MGCRHYGDILLHAMSGERTVNFRFCRDMDFCLPKGRHSKAAHEQRLLCAQKCTRGGVGWFMQGLGGVNLDMPQGIKSDRTIMEVQGIESLTPRY